jgi:hypothetical protein
MQKLLKIQALAAEFVKLKLLILILVGIMNKSLFMSREHILKVALAAKKKENGQHTENATGLDQAQEEISKLQVR